MFGSPVTCGSQRVNSNFTEQCTPLVKNNKLSIFSTVYTELSYFSADHIGDIIKKPDPSKAHGDDMISIRVLKACGDSIREPLKIISENCLKDGIFPDQLKNANVAPIHKKNDKQILFNYLPVSLLSVCSKIFERLIYHSMYKHISDNNVLSSNQLGFHTGDSCINQLLSITYGIYHCFDEGIETKAIFSDIFKAFDKGWHKGLIYKLHQYGFTGNLFTLLTDFLSNRKQGVFLNGKYFSWADIKAGFPEGSILGLLLFPVYVNDLTEKLHSNPKLFADDTSLFSTVTDEVLSNSHLNDDLSKVND